MFFFVLAGLGDVQALSQLNFGLFSEPFFYFRHWRWLMFVNKAISLDKMTQVLHGRRLEIFLSRFIYFPICGVCSPGSVFTNKFIIFLNDLTWLVSCRYRNWEVHAL